MVKAAAKNICYNIMRKKAVCTEMMRTDLKKVLNLSDLTFLSIGSMIGSGLYVLTGTIVRNVAGPSTVLSYVLAAIASALSAVCYAEFAARIPVTGSAYQFTYISVGEIWAFIIGWNVALEHAVAVAAIARAWSGYMDGLFGHPIQQGLISCCSMPGGLVADYPDFLAVGLVAILTIIVALGVKLSSKVNIVFAALNLVVILFIFSTGMYLGRIENWTKVEGGFFPHGFSGTISGAATLIFSYVGYEVVASANEESINPKRDVPLALVISVTMVVIAYVSASASLTLMEPWYNVSAAAPFPSAYISHQWYWAQYVVSIGALAAMTAAMLAAMVVVPRYVYAMARDGLIMEFMAKVNEKNGVPVASTIVCGIFVMITTAIFSLHTLVEFISIGQLLACTFVSICVIKLRYGPNQISRYESFEDDAPTEQEKPSTGANANATEETNFGGKNNIIAERKAVYGDEDNESVVENVCGTVKTSVLASSFGRLFTWTLPYRPGRLPFLSLCFSILFATAASALCLFGYRESNEAWFIILLVVFVTLALASLFFIMTFKQDNTMRTFKVPLVPLIPYMSIVINIILMLKLQSLTWLRLAVWMAVGTCQRLYPEAKFSMQCLAIHRVFKSLLT
uniref:Cationic amino acid transporter 4-like n=1 Tax=Phallusia mammillata TaxID=59560 RepID=A0A6F9DTH6_9ASCI|nr:cationic amino acid transporter 4-like [Phallusia mammillata]